jgi:hypothetical protein
MRPRVPSGRASIQSVADFDARTPSIARVYDYLLGGKDNFEVDRQAARRLLEAFPATVKLARDNREFLARAVTWAAGQGIGQFLDLGAGLPTQENTHQIAREINPDARVVYVDNDPQAVLHAKSLLASPDGIAATQADLTDPEAVFADESVRRVIDFSEPVCVIMASVLHFYPTDVARTIARAYTGRLATASAVAISCVHSDAADWWADTKDNYRASAVHNHSREELLSFFDGLDMVPPGITLASAWRGGLATVPDVPPGLAQQLAGVGVKASADVALENG